jgi:hypothetical protein
MEDKGKDEETGAADKPKAETSVTGAHQQACNDNQKFKSDNVIHDLPPYSAGKLISATLYAIKSMEDAKNGFVCNMIELLDKMT